MWSGESSLPEFRYALSLKQPWAALLVHGLKCIEKEFPNSDYSVQGFEGIRAQDILPLLTRRFDFELFIGFGNIIDIFVDRTYGPNFDPANEWDRSFIDRVQALDQAEIESGRVKPTHMLAALTRQPVSHTKMHKHLSPKFCVRRRRRWFFFLEKNAG